jgi:hypothetical protein
MFGNKADGKSFAPKKDDVSGKVKDNYFVQKGPRNLCISPDITCTVSDRLCHSIDKCID